METLVKLSGVSETVLTKLVKQGYYKTKTEAIRAGIMELGKEYDLIPSHRKKELEMVAEKMIRQDAEMKRKGLKYLTHDEVKKKYGFM